MEKIYWIGWSKCHEGIQVRVATNVNPGPVKQNLMVGKRSEKNVRFVKRDLLQVLVKRQPDKKGKRRKSTEGVEFMKETYWQQYINFLQDKTSYTRKELHEALGYEEYYRKRTRLDTYRCMLSAAGYLKVQKDKPVIILKPVPLNLKSFWLQNGGQKHLEKLKIVNGNRPLFSSYKLKPMPVTFLKQFKELASLGFSSTEIIKHLKIGQQVAKRWREENPEFAKLWEEVVNFNKYKSRPRAGNFKVKERPQLNTFDSYLLNKLNSKQNVEETPVLPFSKVI